MNLSSLYDGPYTSHVLSLKNQVQNICDELSQYGEESAVLVVNPNSNVTGCMGSRFGQEFFQSKLDLLQQFHKYCQECYMVQRVPGNLSYDSSQVHQNQFHPHPMEMKNTSSNQNVYNKNTNGNFQGSSGPANFDTSYRNSMGNMNEFSNTSENYNAEDKLSQGNSNSVSNPQDIKSKADSRLSSVLVTTALLNGCEDQQDSVDQSDPNKALNKPIKRLGIKGKSKDNFLSPENKESKFSGDNYITKTENEIYADNKTVENNATAPAVVKNEDSNNPVRSNNKSVKSKKLRTENKKDKKEKVKSEADDSQTDDYMNETTDEENQIEASPKSEKPFNVKKTKFGTKSGKLSSFLKTRQSLRRMQERKSDTLEKKKYTSRRLYTCSYCEKVYLTASRLTFHIRKMHEDLMTKHTCNVCNESFTKPKGLSRHRVNQGHAQPCNICGKEFVHTPEFKSHMRHHRAQQKKLEKVPIKCEFCPKEFWGKGDLNKHRRVHTKEKPYMCDVCGSQFALPSQLSCHRRSHTGERPYSCKECGKRFTLSNTLARHRRKHSGEKYQCHLCGKQYASRWNLTVHVEYIHTGLTPFKCEFCGKEFNRKDNLKVHKKKHDREREKSNLNTTMVPNSDASADMYLTGLVESAVQGINDVGLGLVPKPDTHAHNQYYTY